MKFVCEQCGEKYADQYKARACERAHTKKWAAFQRLAKPGNRVLAKRCWVIGNDTPEFRTVASFFEARVVKHDPIPTYYRVLVEYEDEERQWCFPDGIRDRKTKQEAGC